MSKVTMRAVWVLEYEADTANYEEGSTPEDMAKFDQALGPELFEAFTDTDGDGLMKNEITVAPL